MESAFGVDHGEISKARIPGVNIPQALTSVGRKMGAGAQKVGMKSSLSGAQKTGSGVPAYKKLLGVGQKGFGMGAMKAGTAMANKPGLTGAGAAAVGTGGVGYGAKKVTGPPKPKMV